MRYGKSWIAVNWAASLYHLEDVRKVIVLTVTSGLGVWEDQVAEHCPVPWRVITHWGEVVWESKGGGDKLEFMIVDYPNVYARARTGQGAEWLVVRNMVLHKFGAQAIVADESHHLGNPTAEISKHSCALARPIRFRLFMTGTMFHRKPFFVFGQMKFYDDGRTFGTAFTQFKKKIAVFGGFGDYKVLRYRNLKWMMDQVKPKVYIQKYVPPRPPVTNRLRFELTGRNLETYNQMELTRVLRIRGEVLAAEIVITQHLWLKMISGGFVKLPSGKYVQVGNDKLNMAKDRLREYLEQDVTKVIIGCRFTAELVAVAKAAKKIGFQVFVLHGGVKKGAPRKERIRAFNATKQPAVFVSQISTGKEAIDLSSADTTLWYSLPESYVEFDQFDKRKEKFKDKRVLMNDFLLARGTHDEVAYEAMLTKKDVARLLVTNPRRVEEITADKYKRR